jgi:hypothetical protein
VTSGGLPGTALPAPHELVPHVTEEILRWRARASAAAQLAAAIEHLTWSAMAEPAAASAAVAGPS